MSELWLYSCICSRIANIRVVSNVYTIVSLPIGMILFAFVFYLGYLKVEVVTFSDLYRRTSTKETEKGL